MKEEYDGFFGRAVVQYNMLIDSLPSKSRKHEKEKLTAAQERTKRRNRLLDRWDVRRMRGKRRTEEWARNIRREQYEKTKAHVGLGARPYIVTPTGNPYMDLYTEVSVSALPVPIDNCAWCQFSLSSPDALLESGPPNSLPCGHTFHYNCIIEFFYKRTKAGEKERHKCPLCSVWFKDVREIPDFYGRYRSKEHVFQSSCESSVLSASEDGDLRGHHRPPWFVKPMVNGSEPVCEEIVEESVRSNETVTLDQFEEAGGSSSQMQEIDATEVQNGGEIQERSEPAQPPEAGLAPNSRAARSDSGYGSATTQAQQDSLHLDCDETDRIDAFEEDQQSYVVILRLPRPPVRRTSRQRRQPRRWVNEC